MSALFDGREVTPAYRLTYLKPCSFALTDALTNATLVTMAIGPGILAEIIFVGVDEFGLAIDVEIGPGTCWRASPSRRIVRVDSPE